MITDGYTESRSFGGVSVQFRPMLQRERKGVVKSAGEIAPEFRRSYFDGHLERHISGVAPSLREMDDDQWGWTLRTVMAVGSAEGEREDIRNLYYGTRMKMIYPHLPSGICGYCQKWWFDPATGTTHQQDGKPIERTEEPLLCETEHGCVVGTKNSPRTLSEKNSLAFQFHLECQAVGNWPDDPIVRRNAYWVNLAASRVRQERDARVRLIRSRV